MFAVEEDKNLELLAWGPAPRHPTPVYGKAPYYSADPCTSDGACSGLNPYTGPYYLTAMTLQGFSIGTPIFQQSAGTPSSSSRASLNRDSIKDYPEMRAKPAGTLLSRTVASTWWPP
jgi:hypothetical protein